MIINKNMTMTMTKKCANALTADKALPDVNEQQLIITNMKAAYFDGDKAIGRGEYVKVEAHSCTGEVATLALTTAQALEAARLLTDIAKGIDRKAGNLFMPF